MPKPWYSIKALAAGSTDTAEVSILSEIGGLFGVSAKQFIADFRAIEAPNVKMFINSPGGSVFDGLAMFNAMVATGKNIEVHVLGIAASMGSYLAMVGKKIVMPANTLMMVHNPSTTAQGNADELRDTADILDKVGASLTATYAKRFKGDASVLDGLLAAESFLTAAECLTYGFCDEVTDEIPVTAQFDVTTLPANVQALFTPLAADVAALRNAPAKPSILIDDVAALAKDAGLEDYLATFMTDPAITSHESAATAINAAREIKAVATYCKLPNEAGALIRARKTLSEARSALSTVLADADAALRIDTASKSPQERKAPAANAWSPQSLWAEIHARSKK